jgi:hypothetical protein
VRVVFPTPPFMLTVAIINPINRIPLEKCCLVWHKLVQEGVMSRRQEAEGILLVQ